LLLVDLDAQANLTTSLTEEKVKETIYEAMTGKIEHLPVIELDDSLDLVPASLSLAMADVELSNVIARRRCSPSFWSRITYRENTISSSLTVLLPLVL
jgi:chromosome partitioning protein